MLQNILTQKWPGELVQGAGSRGDAVPEDRMQWWKLENWCETFDAPLLPKEPKLRLLATVRLIKLWGAWRQESSRPYSDRAVPNQSEANAPAVQCNVNGSVQFSISHCWLWIFQCLSLVLDSLAQAWRHWHDKMMMSAASQAQQKSFSSCSREFQVCKIFSILCHRLGWYIIHGYKVRLLRGLPVDTKDDWRLSLKLPRGVILAKYMPWLPRMQVISASDLRVKPQMDRPCTVLSENTVR